MIEQNSLFVIIVLFFDLGVLVQIKVIIQR